MKRIDSVNARPNINGTGKTGFHDNADLSGQDATYLTPDFMNHLQEELCNLLEMNGVALNSNARDQLYQLLTGNADIDALAAATQVKLDQEQTWRTDADNWLQQQINNEQTARINAISQEQTWRENADADLENRKFDKAGGTVAGDALITGGLTVQTSLLLGSFLAAQNGYTPLPNGLILQWGKVSDDFAIYNFPIEFPNAAFALIGQQISGGGSSKVYVEIISKSQFKVFEGSSATDGTKFYWFAIGV